MDKITYVADVLDSDWDLPAGFRAESVDNVVKFWAETVRQSSGSVPVCRLQRDISVQLIKDIGYKEVIRTLAFMATPYSKFFQYPYTLRAVRRGHTELLEYKEIKLRPGFIGSIGLTNLQGDSNESQRKAGRRERRV